MNLTFSHFEEIIKKGYNLDIVFLLTLVNQQECSITSQECNVKELCYENPKLSLLYQTLIRKGLITEECKLTLEGKSLVDFLSTPIESKIDKKKPVPDDFELWWKAYPGTDTFTHHGKTFRGTRAMRVRKDECKLKFNKILGEGEYTVHELIKALELEVNQKKDNSVKSGSNRMTFMQNSLTYLNQRTFDLFIELIREGHVEQESQAPLKDVDI